MATATQIECIHKMIGWLNYKKGNFIFLDDGYKSPLIQVQIIGSGDSGTIA